MDEFSRPGNLWKMSAILEKASLPFRLDVVVMDDSGCPRQAFFSPWPRGSVSK